MAGVLKWLKQNTESLSGKTVAITGSTGGLGQAICRHLATLGASFVLVDRNATRSHTFGEALANEFGVAVSYVTADLADMASVKRATVELSALPVDILIHNAGAYDIPRAKTDIGYDNVFQINFIAPYYMTKMLLPTLRERAGRVVVVGSIAHNYSKTDPADVDFSTRKAASKVYGNAKRYLMFALDELIEREEKVALAVTHPGISFTGITDHYPPVIFAIIKYPMKVVFMKPRAACLSAVKGVFEETRVCEWIGPRVLDVWGMPRKKPLDTCKFEERKRIFKTAEDIFETL